MAGASGMAAPDDGELEGGVGGASGMQAPDAGDVAGFVAPMDDGERGVHLQMSMLPTDMRDVHHSRLLQQIASGTTVSPELKRLRESGAMVVRTGSDLFPHWHDHFWELAFPFLFPFGSCGPSYKRHHKLSLDRYMRLAMGDASGVWARDPLFCLVAYEVVTHRRLRTGAKLKARMPGYTRAAGGAKRAGLQR